MSDLLTKTTELGVIHEFFNPEFVPQVAESVEADDEASFLSGIQAVHRSLNGVFGVKTTPAHIALFSTVDPIEHLRFNARRTVFVVLRRRDILRQAVSLYLANRTGVFHDTGQKIVPPAASGGDYDADEVLACMRHLIWEEMMLELLVAEKKIEPIRLFYEDIVSDPQTVLDIFYSAVLGRRAARRSIAASHVKLDRPDTEAVVSTVQSHRGRELADLRRLRPPFDMRLAEVAAQGGDAYRQLSDVAARTKYFQLISCVGRGLLFFSNEDVFSGEYALSIEGSMVPFAIKTLGFQRVADAFYACRFPEGAMAARPSRLTVAFGDRTYDLPIPAYPAYIGHVDSVQGGLVTGWVATIGDRPMQQTLSIRADGVSLDVPVHRVRRDSVAFISNREGLDGFECRLPAGADPAYVEVLVAEATVVCDWRRP